MRGSPSTEEVVANRGGLSARTEAPRVTKESTTSVVEVLQWHPLAVHSCESQMRKPMPHTPKHLNWWVKQ